MCAQVMGALSQGVQSGGIKTIEAYVVEMRRAKIDYAKKALGESAQNTDRTGNTHTGTADTQTYRRRHTQTYTHT